MEDFITKDTYSMKNLFINAKLKHETVVKPAIHLENKQRKYGEVTKDKEDARSQGYYCWIQTKIE